MFEITTNHLIQLLIAMGCGLFLFILSYVGLQRLLFKALIIIIPFQFIDSVYGSLNMALTYVLGASMLLNQSWIKKGSDENWPLMIPFFILLCSFILSWTQAPGIFMTKNAFYLIMLGSNVVLFYMSYHFISEEEDIHAFFKLLFLCNALVICYCIVQLIVGFGEFRFLGIKEFTFQQNRLDRRLVGPFNAVGITAEYLVIQCLLIGYYIMTVNRYRMAGVILIFSNIAVLIGTGNRGGFISFIVGLILFNYVFRKSLGLKKIAVGSFVIFILFISASVYMIKYTDFNVLYSRIAGTKMHGITPEDRGGWPLVIDKAMKKPTLGHGPRLVSKTDQDIPAAWPKQEIGFYPHNLYLYIFYTMGVLGLFAYGTLGFVCFKSFLKSRRKVFNDKSFVSGLPSLAILVFAIVLLDQMKVEALRYYLLDYQHFLSALFGMFCGLGKVAGELSSQTI
jgi:O-antigen ligase